MSIDTLELGRDAIRRHAWTEATRGVRGRWPIVISSPGRPRALGEAAWWGGHPDNASDALERAFAAYLATARPSPAAGVAFRLTYLAFRRLAGSIGVGWLARAERLLENEPKSGDARVAPGPARSHGAHAESGWPTPRRTCDRAIEMASAQHGT